MAVTTLCAFVATQEKRSTSINDLVLIIMLSIVEAREKILEAGRNLTNCNIIYQKLKSDGSNRYRSYAERKRYQYAEKA